ncbi:hypothetical protein BCR34DRAFT_567563 [Clohesyomyces aquaticus]|uniref:Uncharacterized protein n=1 Tax=Clohesyomyces aquaticus TaxID=1231657 RepID=A0A1Y1ZIF6_9PLEO|nr:hypothetical protein BCR34DRAFT_567563 [Clohesyomyces aquaticus]
MADSSPASSQDLSYPPVRVNRSLARLDLDALIMRSNLRQPAEEPAGALEDSTYDMLVEDAYGTSDDEGHTESLASTEGNTPDDVSSLADTEDGFDDGDLIDASQQLPHPLAASATEPFDPRASTSQEDSMITSKADTQFGEASYIQIEEHAADGQESLDGCGIIRTFNQARGFEALKPYDCPDIRFTVRLGLSHRFLSISETYRVMYVGDFPDWAKDEITGQIGAALDVSSHSSRFSVVRVQEGASSNKTLLVNSPNVSLDVVHCTPLKIVEHAGKPHGILLALRDGKQLIFGPGRAPQLFGESSAFQVPDLVVLCHPALQPEPESESEIEQTTQMRFARETFQVHNIPCLDVGMVWPFRNCPKSFSFDNDSLRLCVEGRKASSYGYENLDTLPIDIYGFLQIEPSQLNRHLAYISGAQDDSYPVSFSANAKGTKMVQEQAKEAGTGWAIRNLLRPFEGEPRSANDSEWWQLLKTWGTLFALTAMVAAYMLALGRNQAVVPNISQQVVPPPSSPSVYMCPPSSILPKSNPPSPSVSSIPVVSSNKSTMRDITTIPAEETPLEPKRDSPASAKDTKVPGFQLQVSGDHQFILTPAGYLVRGKRRPQLQVQVVRDSQIIPIRMTEAKNGSYTIELERDYPLGTFNVSVVAKRKPLLYEDFQVTLGSSKSRISSLFDNVNSISKSLKHDVTVAQHNLKNLSSHISKNIQAGLIMVEDTATAAFGQTKQWKQQIQESTQSVAEHLQEASRAASHQLSVGARVTKDVSQIVRQNWEVHSARLRGLMGQFQGVHIPSLWETTRPIRTSSKLQKAHKNAQRLWQKAGEKGQKTPKSAKSGGKRKQSKVGKLRAKVQKAREKRK